MYKVYAFATPNSIKVLVALEELGMDYELHPVNVRQGEQKEAAFLALNPNGKVPVLVDRDNATESLVVTESAAILVYLAEKTGKLLPESGPERVRVFEQLFFHASGLSPAFGQAGFFQRLVAEPQPLAIERFTTEARRTTTLLEQQLEKYPFVAGETFTLADIAHFGWFWRSEFAGVNLEPFPQVSRWYTEILNRPAVQHAIERISALA